MTLTSIARQIASESFSFDRGFLHTVWSLSRQPGMVIQDVVNGRTVPYTPTIRYFLITLAVTQIIAFWAGNIQDFAGGIAEGAGPALFSISGTIHFFSEFFVLIAAGVVPFAVIATRKLIVRSPHNLAEHAVFHLYTMGHGALILATLTLIAELFSDTVQNYLTVLAFLPVLLYYIWSATTFFAVSKIRSAVCTALALGLASMIYGICLFLLVMLVR